MKNKKVLFIGCGNMGEAVLKSFLDFGFDAKNIFVVEKGEDRKRYLEQVYGVDTFLRNVSTESFDKLRMTNVEGQRCHDPKHARDFSLKGDFQILLLAIKPQQLEELSFEIPDNCLVISVLAGTKISKIQKTLSVKKVARVMPNLPLMFGEGMSTFYGENLSDEESDLVLGIFSESGKIFKLKSEEEMHKSTLLAGSGPGFYFYFVSIFEKIALDYGFSKEEAIDLARQTLIGSAEVLKKSEDSAETWQSRVTSKGGTTERSIEEFEKLGLEEVFKKSLDKGIERSRELGK